MTAPNRESRLGTLKMVSLFGLLVVFACVLTVNELDLVPSKLDLLQEPLTTEGFAIRDDTSDRHTESDGPPPPLLTRTLEREDVELRLEALGRVRAAREIALKTEVAGRVTAVSPKLVKGGFVEENDELFRISDQSYRSQLAQSQKALAQARLDLAKEKAEQEQAQDDLAALDLNSETALASRLPQMALAEAKVAAAEADVLLAQHNLDQTSVRPPYSGYVIERLVSLGEVVDVGDALVRILDPSRLLVDVSLSKGDLARIRQAEDQLNRTSPGVPEPLRVSISERWGQEELVAKAKIASFGAVLEPDSGFQPMVLEVVPATPLTGMQIKPGSVVTAQISLGRLQGVFRLDKRHLSDDGSVARMDGSGQLVREAINVAYQTYSDVFFFPSDDTDEFTVVLTPPIDLDVDEGRQTMPSIDIVSELTDAR